MDKLKLRTKKIRSQINSLLQHRACKMLLCLIITLGLFLALYKIPMPERLCSFLRFVIAILGGFYFIYQVTRVANIKLRRSLFNVFSFFILLFCVVGSWQLCAQKMFGDNWRFDIAVIQNVISLLTATTKNSIEADTPVFYEIARMTAPLLTTFCIYFLIEEVVLRYIGVLRFEFSKKPQILIFGYHDQALSLIKDLIEHRQNDTSNVVLICDHKIDNKLRLSLEQKGIILLEVDYRYKEKEDDPYDIKTIVLDYLKLNKAEKICLLEDDSTNLLLFYKLVTSPEICNRNVSFSVEADNPATSETIVSLYNAIFPEPEGSGKSDNTDTSEKTDKSADSSPLETLPHPLLFVFSSSDLMIYDLIIDKPFNMPILESYRGMKNQKNGQKDNKEELKSLKTIRTPHIVITGFNDCAMSALKYIMRTGLLNIDLKKRTRVTLIDKLEEKNALNKIRSFYPMIDEVIDLRVLNRDPENVDYISTLHPYIDVPISYFLSCYSSMEKNIICLKGMIKYLEYLNYSDPDSLKYKVPLAVRISENQDFSDVLKKAYSTLQDTIPFEVCCFGSSADLYAFDNLFRNETEKDAKDFHENYRKIGGTDDRIWEKLDYDTIESNRSCVLSAPYFKKLCELMNVDQTILSSEFNHFIEGFQAAETQEEKNSMVINFLKYYDLDQLAELEHLRWMAFHYSLGYLSSNESFANKIYVILEQEEAASKQNRKIFKQKEKTIHFGRNHNNLISFDEIRKNNAETIRYDIQNIILYPTVAEHNTNSD